MWMEDIQQNENMKKVLIIAEAGVNHNGSIELAKKLVEEAMKSGADYVKFQTSEKPESVVSRFAKMADYQKKNIGKDESQLEMVKRMALTYSDFENIKSYCDTIGMNFISTPFDLNTVDFLSNLGMDYMKIPSGEITNLPYLRKIAKKGIPVIMSTGMCTLGEVETALNILEQNGLNDDMISLLHCNTEYPTPYVDVNLKAMLSMKDCFGLRVGYSDHTQGIEVPIAAVALGAEIIEKHFTIDKSLPGPDHIASLEPDELTQMVSAIRHIELAIGDGKKKVSGSERKNVEIARRSIVAARDIRKGEILTEGNLTTKRPGIGISPMKWDSVIGTIAIKDFQEDELIVL